MNEFTFLVQRSILSALALGDWVSTGYNLPNSTTCQLWRRGINDLYIIKAKGTKLVLRISPTNWRSFEQLTAEIDLLKFLHRNHISVPEPIQHKDGTYHHTLNAPEGPRYAVIFSFVPGVQADPTQQEHSYHYGQAIAQLHSVTDGYPTDRAGFRFELSDMVDKPLVLLKPLFVAHQVEWNYLCEIADSLKNAVGEMPHRIPEYGICHGDVNSGNIHFINNTDWALLDFEYFGYGWRVFDIATFVNNQVHQLGRTDQAKEIVDAFLEGYQSERVLSQIELGLLPSFVILRQLWLLGIGAKNLPNIGLSLFENWAFDICMPFIRAWMDTPFWGWAV